MLTTLVRLLALSLVPVMIFALPRSAEAAYKVGDVADASFSMGGSPATGGLSCTVTGHFVNSNGAASVRLEGNCSTGWQVSHAALTLTVDGGSCEFAIHYPQLDGSGDLAGQMAQTSVGPLNVATCVGTQLCYQGSVGYHGDMWADPTDYDGCVPFALGQMPDAAGNTISDQCKWGLPNFPTMGTTYRSGNYDVTPFTFTAQMAVPDPPDSSALAWRTYGVYKTADGIPRRVGEPVVHSHQLVEGPFSAANNMWMDYREASKQTLVGVGMYHVIEGQGSGMWATDRMWDGSAGIFGATDPSTCRYYWGDKVANDAATEIDEPLGPLGSSGAVDDVDPVLAAEPAPTPACDGFSLWDPASWAGAGVCAIVQAVMWLGEKLAALLRTLADAVGAIASAILDGLSALFVPDEAFLQAKSDQIKDAWSNTPPVVFVDGAQEVGNAFVVGAPSSSCEGPGLTITSPVGGGTHTLNPMSACGAAMSNLAALIKLALTVLVYVGGFLAAVRIVAASFGIDASIGRETADA